MTEPPLASRSTVDWADMPEDVYEAVLIAYRMASDRERGHERCPRRVCRGAKRCLALPEAPGEAPCASLLTPFAFGHAVDHWRYAGKLIDMARARGRKR